LEETLGATAMPCAMARRITSAVVRTLSFRFMFVRWVSTVFTLMESRRAMSFVE